MLIAIDIGNSSINIGFWGDKGLLTQKIETFPLKTPEEYRSIFEGFLSENSVEKNTTGVIISSVVPGYTEVLRETLRGLISVEPLMVSCRIKTGLKFNIPNPEELGSDRIANAVAAYELYRCPVAVVDFGTATTISVVGGDADYIGGSIMPGVRLMNESLARGTAKLPEVELKVPASALGTVTTECIQSGLIYGTAGAVERLLAEIEKEVGWGLKVVVTGGYGGIVSKFLRKKYELRPNLTLEGLRIIYMRNRDA
ncbi:MAG: type III pantothenate kinase [Nitrospirota bacterium]